MHIFTTAKDAGTSFMMKKKITRVRFKGALLLDVLDNSLH